VTDEYISAKLNIKVAALGSPLRAVRDFYVLAVSYNHLHPNTINILATVKTIMVAEKIYTEDEAVTGNNNNLCEQARLKVVADLTVDIDDIIIQTEMDKDFIEYMSNWSNTTMRQEQ
jgi:hypothetical protein